VSIAKVAKVVLFFYDFHLAIIFTFLNLRASEHDNQLDVVLPNHLPEVRNGVDRRILSGNELLVVVEPSNPTSVDVITT
jgi:hypothetical protein